MEHTRMQWLWENMKGYRLAYAVGILGTIVYNALHLAVPYITQVIIDLFLTGENAQINLTTRQNLFFGLLAAMIAVTIFRTAVVYYTCMIFEKISQGVLYRIRNFLYDKIQRQDMKFYSAYRTGDLMTRLTGDLDAVRHMIAWVIRTITESLALVTATMIYFFLIDWRLALSILVIAPFLFGVIVLFNKKVAPRHALLREKLSGLNTATQENISGNRVVKAFAREDYEMEKFDRCNEEYSRTNIETALTWLEYYPYIETFADLMPVVLLVVGGTFIINGQITMGEYAAFSGLIWAITNPMRNLGSIMNEFQRFRTASAKVMEIYYSEPEIKDLPDALDRPERFAGKVEFRNVSFQYEDGDLPILTDISFTANPGETIAIMGETGCGKTSLIHLIPRFYEATQGTVLIDDIDVRKLKLKQLRKNIGLATQDVLLYSDTIDGNIAYGDSHMSQEQVVKFARYSAASDFIAKMPEGYDTIVGERGVGLSGGQKQRISLARALAVKPAILILDDTTSAVDLETEKMIQDGLRSLDFPCTKIIIAQRISTTKFADKILVLQNGRIMESGTHDELMKKHGYYYDVVTLQTGGQEDMEGGVSIG
ncbi:MAG: ABC transporter ATP-binding protein [Lachnospiraceae bacterium]